MLAKVELFRIPVFGGAMRAAGFIPVDRNNRTKAIESVNYARDLLDSGASVFVAPEGTRSPTGALLPFKKGGFILAEETGLPILPVTLDGAAAILPARTRTLHLDREVRVVIHPRISPQGLKRDELMSRVRTAIASGLSVRGPA
jgi:1-acyl-sn-glycerol-3-phosphate acyltransferase